MNIDERLEYLLLKEFTSSDLDFAGYGPGDKVLGQAWLKAQKYIKRKGTAKLRGNDHVQVSVTDWKLTDLGWDRLEELERKAVGK